MEEKFTIEYSEALWKSHPQSTIKSPTNLRVYGELLYIIDGNRIIVVRVSTREIVRYIKNDRLQSPTDLVVILDRIYVTDSEARCISIFQIDGTFVGAISSSMRYPKALTYDAVGNRLLIADYRQHCIYEYDLATSEIREFIGCYGRETSQFRYPSSITINGDNIIIADQDNKRYQRFNSKGKFLNMVEVDCHPFHLRLYQGLVFVSGSYISRDFCSINTIQIYKSSKKIWEITTDPRPFPEYENIGNTKYLGHIDGIEIDEDNLFVVQKDKKLIYLYNISTQSPIRTGVNYHRYIIRDATIDNLGRWDNYGDSLIDAICKSSQVDDECIPNQEFRQVLYQDGELVRVTGRIASEKIFSPNVGVEDWNKIRIPIPFPNVISKDMIWRKVDFDKDPDIYIKEGTTILDLGANVYLVEYFGF